MKLHENWFDSHSVDQLGVEQFTRESKQDVNYFNMTKSLIHIYIYIQQNAKQSILITFM